MDQGEFEAAMEKVGKLASLKIVSALQKFFGFPEHNVVIGFRILTETDKEAPLKKKHRTVVFAMAKMSGLFFKVLPKNGDIVVELIAQSDKKSLADADSIFKNVADSMLVSKPNVNRN